MNKKNKKRKKINWPAITLTVVFLLLIAWGIKGLTRKVNEPRDSVVYTVTHYPDLEITKPEGEIVRYEGFSLCFDERRHTPRWVGWELLASEASGEESRSNRFWQDDDIYGCPAPSDYTNSGYDRGHLCPAADQKWSKQAMRDCFSMANMAPQDHALNSGAWATLEKKERLWAERDSAIVIIAGPVYSGSNPKKIGDTGVHVPDAFFKVFLAPYLDKPRAIGFIYPNTSAPGNMQDYSMSVDGVEKITGLDFFSALPDSIENRVEAVYSFNDWNRR